MRNSAHGKSHEEGGAAYAKVGSSLRKPPVPELLLLSPFSRVRLCATPWTAAYQAPPSMGFSRQEYWSGVPLPSPEDTRNWRHSLEAWSFHWGTDYLINLRA